LHASLLKGEYTVTKMTVYDSHMQAVEALFPDDEKRATRWKALTWFGALAWDQMRLVNIQLRGWSFRCSQMTTLLTIRATIGEEHVVSFITGIDAGDCLDIAFRQWQADALRWSPDKFA